MAVRKQGPMTVPIIATRGVVVFPGNDMAIEVGRRRSIKAVERSVDHHDSLVFVVSQKDLLVELPKEDDLYKIGTLCEIKQVKRKEGYQKVTVRSLERAQMINFIDNGDHYCADVEVLHDEEQETSPKN